MRKRKKDIDMFLYDDGEPRVYIGSGFSIRYRKKKKMPEFLLGCILGLIIVAITALFLFY